MDTSSRGWIFFPLSLKKLLTIQSAGDSTFGKRVPFFRAIVVNLYTVYTCKKYFIILLRALFASTVLNLMDISIGPA